MSPTEPTLIQPTPTFHGPFFPPSPTLTFDPPLRRCPCGRQDEHDHPLLQATLTDAELADLEAEESHHLDGLAYRLAKRVRDAARDKAIAATLKAMGETLNDPLFLPYIAPNVVDVLLKRARRRLES